jgi:hypothetical protein
LIQVSADILAYVLIGGMDEAEKLREFLHRHRLLLGLQSDKQGSGSGNVASAWPGKPN